MFIQCCIIPKILKHEGHQHSLFLATSSFETCNACGEDCEDGVNSVCTNCKFNISIRCATFPLEAKYQYDTHLLKLFYTREGDLGRILCMICEEEKDHPRFYYYAKCKFIAHPRCIIGENMCIKFS
jgi:hypothetical protein